VGTVAGTGTHGHAHQAGGAGAGTETGPLPPAPPGSAHGHAPGHVDGNQWRYYGNPRDGMPATPATHSHYGHGQGAQGQGHGGHYSHGGGYRHGGQGSYPPGPGPGPPPQYGYGHGGGHGGSGGVQQYPPPYAAPAPHNEGEYPPYSMKQPNNMNMTPTPHTLPASRSGSGSGDNNNPIAGANANGGNSSNNVASPSGTGVGATSTSSPSAAVHTASSSIPVNPTTPAPAGASGAAITAAAAPMPVPPHSNSKAINNFPAGAVSGAGPIPVPAPTPPQYYNNPNPHSHIHPHPYPQQQYPHHHQHQPHMYNSASHPYPQYPPYPQHPQHQHQHQVAPPPMGMGMGVPGNSSTNGAAIAAANMGGVSTPLVKKGGISVSGGGVNVGTTPTAITGGLSTPLVAKTDAGMKSAAEEPSPLVSTKRQGQALGLGLGLGQTNDTSETWKRSIDQMNEGGATNTNTNLTTPAAAPTATVSPGQATEEKAKVTTALDLDTMKLKAVANVGGVTPISTEKPSADGETETATAKEASSNVVNKENEKIEPDAKRTRMAVKEDSSISTSMEKSHMTTNLQTPAKGVDGSGNATPAPAPTPIVAMGSVLNNNNASSVMESPALGSPAATFGPPQTSTTPMVSIGMGMGGMNPNAPVQATPLAVGAGIATTPAQMAPYGHGPPSSYPGATGQQLPMASPENYAHDPYYSMHAPSPSGAPHLGYYQHQQHHNQVYHPHAPTPGSGPGAPHAGYYQHQQPSPTGYYYDPMNNNDPSAATHGNPHTYGHGGHGQQPQPSPPMPMDGYQRDNTYGQQQQHQHGIYPPSSGHSQVPGTTTYPPHNGHSHPHVNQHPLTPFVPQGDKNYVSPEQQVGMGNDVEGDYTKMLKSKGPRLTDRKKLQNKAWFDRFEELKTYLEEIGDCLVPQKYPPNPSLGTWVNKQRMEYKLLMDKNKSSMTDERLDALQSIGFTWAKRKGQATWDAKFSQLLDYKSINGDCLIPTKYSKDLALGRWVSTQREQYRMFKQGDPKSKMTVDRAGKLEEVGFVWRLQF